jgi:hypothetical protein
VSVEAVSLPDLTAPDLPQQRIEYRRLTGFGKGWTQHTLRRAVTDIRLYSQVGLRVGSYRLWCGWARVYGRKIRVYTSCDLTSPPTGNDVWWNVPIEDLPEVPRA